MEVFVKIFNGWNLSQTSNMSFCQSVNLFHKKFHLWCLTRFWMCFCICLLIFCLFTGKDVFLFLHFYTEVLKEKVCAKWCCHIIHSFSWYILIILFKNSCAKILFFKMNLEIGSSNSEKCLSPCNLSIC